MFGNSFAWIKIVFGNQNRFWPIFVMFGCIFLESILASKINFGRSEIFLLFVSITFRGTTKYKLFYLKINSNKLILFRINSTKAELNHLLPRCLLYYKTRNRKRWLFNPSFSSTWMSTLVNSKILVESQRASDQDTLCPGLMMHIQRIWRN